MVESYRRTLEKGLATSLAEDGHDWNLYPLAIAVAHNNFTPSNELFSLFLNTWARGNVASTAPFGQALAQPHFAAVALQSVASQG